MDDGPGTERQLDGRRQRQAILVAAAWNVLLLAVLGIVARSLHDQYLPVPAISGGGPQQVLASDFKAATAGCGACLVALAVAWVRAPQAEHYERLTPPARYVAGGAAAAITGWLGLSDIQMDQLALPLWWSILFWAIGGAAAGWTLAIWVGGESPDSDVAQLSPDAILCVGGDEPGPSSLVHRPKVRWWWLGGWGALGIGGFLLITLMGDTQRRDVAIGLGVAAIAGAIGLVALRWGVAADEHGLTVSNSLRHHRIAWPDLELIALEEVPGEVSVGFYRLVFVVGPRHRRIVADAPTGLPSPGHEVYQLGHDLAAMHKRYSTSR